ncbi:MAG: ABC transporter ATP-binding protein [Rhodobacteraceae bacterium]|nr:ABC transporter ATP-binding protein [Paracoccaceae bacterium]
MTASALDIKSQSAPSEDAFLKIAGLSKRFGGLQAVNDVTIDFQPGLLHAIIGPNGAGKTTFFNLISGMIKPDTGSASFMGAELVGMRPHSVSQHGVIRTLQVKSVFNSLSVAQNIQVSAQSRGTYLNPVADSRRDKVSLDKTAQIIEELGLHDIAGQTAGTLSYGDVALLEIGMALALEPRLILFDEPICGMSPAETARTVEKIVELSKRMHVILIEHDMDVVFEIADLVTVMNQGAVLARGTSKEIAADPHVRAAYLGEEE